MVHQEKMDENTKQMRRSDRKQTPSEKAIHSECNIVKNLIKPNSSPELSGDKNTESKEGTNENSMVQPSQMQQSQLISLTQNSQPEG